MDFNVFAANLGLELDEYVELVELFIETAESDIRKIKAAFEKNDSDRLAEAAHSLKGSAGNLGFAALSENAKIAEDNSRKDNLDGIDELTSEIEEMLEKIKQNVKK